MPSQDKHSSHIRSVASLLYKWAKLQQLPNTSSRQLANSQTYKLKKPSAHKPTNSPAQKLKLLFFILQTSVCLPPHSSENVAYKANKRLLFLILHAFLLVCF